ncbi:MULTISPECIES: AMP-binding protein [unclassified Pseudofrankia]|uniref:AMP-binding protein n=1 Tax=unclassified Pseudofrankia TaxID=2994372 RepID=UPI0008D9A790|nr:acyl-CoA synthetase [Pseudofrankia sp. BMG5.36]
MPDLLIAALGRNPDKPAVYIGDLALTAAEVAAEISRYAQAYASVGLRVGSRTAMLAPNRPEVLFAMGANMITGCRSTSLHPLGSVDDHVYVLTDAEVETLVVDEKFADRAAVYLERVPTLRQVLTFGPTDLGPDLLALAPGFTPAPLRAPAVGPDDVGGLTYTGGTTGRPKGVLGTYRNAAAMTHIQLTEWQWPDEPRFLMCTPLSHAGAAFFIPVLLRGGCLVVLPGFEPGAVIDAIEKYRISATMLVPTMIYVLLDHPKLATADVSSLRTIYYGAAAMSPARLAEGINRFGQVFFQYYGQSESPMTVTVLRREEHDLSRPERLASCGRPVPWVRVALLDDDGNEVPDGEPGEICVRGPLNCGGYWKLPEQTAELFRYGWLHTGDIARRDEEGYLYIVDRKKDMVISGGFNIFPREVEDVLSAHPAVAAAAVIGVPDEKWGEAVKAVVVRRRGVTVPDDELAAELTALVRDRKGPHHAPKTVDFTDSIPVSPLGKPDKKTLRARYWSTTARQVN